MIFAYRRINGEERHVVILNFSQIAFPSYELWHEESWATAQKVREVREVFNSNSKSYGGNGDCLNASVEMLWHDWKLNGYRVSIPAQSGIILKETT